MKGLYALTDPILCGHGDQLLASAAAAIRGGISVLQYRDKASSHSVRGANAHALSALCREHGVTFIINDDVHLAKRVNADGVHLGQGDMSLSDARDVLGAHKIIGVTCHADIALAAEAEQSGADYVAFGAFYPSKTKPLAKPAPLSVLDDAKQSLTLPIVAIGGIAKHNIVTVHAAGADLVAVVGAVFSHDVANIESATCELVQLIN